MRFVALTLIEIISLVLGVAVSIGMAVAGAGYWALVAMRGISCGRNGSQRGPTPAFAAPCCRRVQATPDVSRRARSSGLNIQPR